MIKFWLHLETLPENSVAKQCLHISHQLATDEKPSFIFTINELLKKYDINPQNNAEPLNHYADLQIIKNNIQKIKKQIANDLKTHQMEMIRSNRKLNFYTIFKTDVSKSEYLEHIKNQKHRKAVAKLRSGNHNLRIESGRHCTPKIPEHLRICHYCHSYEIENETHFLLYCDRYKDIRQTMIHDIKLNYPNYDELIDQNKIMFLFNNVDPFICRKLGYFIFQAFELRDTCTTGQGPTAIS